jgi:hypothetical protein
LAVQDDDVSISELETQLAELQPRLDAMAKERDQALAALRQARQNAESEERRRRGRPPVAHRALGRRIRRR